MGDELPTKYKEGIPRVSRIVEALFPFEGTEDEFRFHNWLKSKDIPVDEYMRVASSYWTAIHKGMEDHISWFPILDSEYEPYLTKYTNYGIDFLKKENVAPLHTEHFICTEDYQGTIDLIAWIDWELWILDWKTYWIAQEILGTKWSKWKYKKPYNKLKKATIQLSLYAYGSNMGIKNIGVVELADDGYHFHKLKKLSSKEIKEIINQYNLT